MTRPIRPIASPATASFSIPTAIPRSRRPGARLSAIDLNSGTYLWRIPLGEYPSLSDKSTGSENYGGPILTAGGVLFIAATLYDKKIPRL